MEEIIQVGLTSASNPNYIKLLINSMKLLANNPKNLEFIIGVDTGKKYNFDIDDFKEHKIVQFNAGKRYCSRSHGQIMDHLIYKHLDKTFGMLVDSDVCFLKKGWDSLFINELTNKNLLYIGTENCNKSRKFPGPYCMFFKTHEIKKMNYSTLPVQSVYFEKKYDFGKAFEDKLKSDWRNFSNGCLFKIEKNAIIYDLNNGDEMLFDTNSQFNIFFRDKKSLYLLLNYQDINNSNCKFLTGQNRGQEFSLNSEVILTHQGRSRSRWNLDERNINWLKDIKSWFKEDELKILFNKIK
jgi:hypothetical protein